ncbi:hypothetical protein Hanom_Chr09g00867911 [Helianthus anomalus]
MVAGWVRDNITETTSTRYTPPPATSSTRYISTKSDFRYLYHALLFGFVSVIVGWGEIVGCGDE